MNLHRHQNLTMGGVSSVSLVHDSLPNSLPDLDMSSFVSIIAPRSLEEMTVRPNRGRKLSVVNPDAIQSNNSMKQYVTGYSDMLRPLRAECPRCVICYSRCNYICRQCHARPKDSFIQLPPPCYCSLEHARRDIFHWAVCDEIQSTLESLTIHNPFTRANREAQALQHITLKSRLQGTLKEVAIQIDNYNTREAAYTAAIGYNTLTRLLIGPDDAKNIHAREHLALCALRANEMRGAKFAISQIEHYWISTNTPVGLRDAAELSKLSGMLKMLEARTDRRCAEEAVRYFSEEVYYTTMLFGNQSWQLALSMWRLGGAFLIQNKPQITDSMYKQCTKVWMDILEVTVLGAKTQTINKSLLVNLTKEPEEDDFPIDTNIYATDCLLDIYRSRLGTEALNNPHENARVCLGLALAYYELHALTKSLKFVEEATNNLARQSHFMDFDLERKIFRIKTLATRKKKDKQKEKQCNMKNASRYVQSVQSEDSSEPVVRTKKYGNIRLSRA